MRLSTFSMARLNLLLIASALGWLTLASPAATAGPSPSPSPSATPAPGTLGVTVLGVDDSHYPDIGVTMSIVDSATGRPEKALATSNVELNPTAKVTAVTAATASTSDLPAAYVIAIDCSFSMANLRNGSSGPTFMDQARSLANAFMAGLGPNDVVKIVSFDQADTPSKVAVPTETAWLKKGDPVIASSIAGIKYEYYGSPLSAWLLAASNIAKAAPQGVSRRAMIFITDANSGDKDGSVTPDLRTKLGPPTFLIGLQSAANVGPEMTQNLSDVATYTGGSYQTAAADADPTALFKPVLLTTHSTWNVTFSTDLVPSTVTPSETLTIHDAQGSTGAATVTFASTGLFTKSQVQVDGLADNATVTADQKVTVSLSGYTSWKGGYELELYLDCDPQPQGAHCSPLAKPVVSGGQGAPLTWQILVATMPQGLHHAYARYVVTYDNVQYFSPTTTLDFTRSGTTWNIAFVILVGGIAVLLIGAFFIASRRRGAPRTGKRAR